MGPQFGILLSGKEKGTLQGQKIDSDLKDIMKGIDFSLVLGIGFNPTDNLNLGVRYNFGISPVFDKPENAPLDYPTVYSRVAHFYLGWTF